MGLTSNQARLLMLTARKSDLEFDMIMLNQRQLELAQDSIKASNEYIEAMSNQKLVMRTPSSDEALGYKSEDITYQNLASMGYLILSPDESTIYITQNDDGTWNIPSLQDGSAVFDNGIEEDEDGNPIVHIKGKMYDIADGKELISDKKQLNYYLGNNLFHILNTTGKNTAGLTLDQLEANTLFEMVDDTSDDAAAQSKYDNETKKIKKEETLLEQQIKADETEYNAVVKELDSIKELQKNNIDKTYEYSA